MALLNPLLESSPVAAPHHHAHEHAAPTAPPNILLGVLRRWPWLLLGVATGLVLGLLYHMQRAPIYQSSAQLLVIKNRAESSFTGPKARVQLVEDYVATQVVFLRSERIMEQAAKRLDNHKPFQVPPPASDYERVAFITQRFAVVREKEPGSNTMSNILLLTFKAAHPADAPKYLRAIIEAYQLELGTVYEKASADQAKALQKEIDLLTNSLTKLNRDRGALERKLRGDPGTSGVVEGGLSQEELNSIRARITANKLNESKLRYEKVGLERQLNDIKLADGSTRATRLATMMRLGIPVERSSILDPAKNDPDGLLSFYKFKQMEMSNRYGPGHPEMVQLRNLIKLLEDEIKMRGGPPHDELDRHRIKLSNDLDTITEQLKGLSRDIVDDERKAAQMSDLQYQIDQIQGSIQHDGKLRSDQIREKERIDATKSAGGYKVEDITRPGDGAQIAPVLLQSLLLGAVLGLMLGAGLGLWTELADRSFRSPLDIRRHLAVPVLGHVPPIQVNEPPEIKPVTPLDPILAAHLRPHSAESEAIRGLRTQLLFSTSGREHQVIQVTSPNPGDGKTTIAANLAISLAKSEKRVVLVDCDFRKPRVHRLFAIKNPELGLASVVADVADLGAAVQSCEIENLSLLPCGPRPENPAELLTTPKFQEILEELRANYEFVIVDTPPVLAVSDPAAVAPRTDGVILVFRMTKDSKPAVTRARDDIVAVGGRILGVVVNASSERELGYGYGHGYRYEYQYADSYADPR